MSKVIITEDTDNFENSLTRLSNTQSFSLSPVTLTGVVCMLLVGQMMPILVHADIVGYWAKTSSNGTPSLMLA